MLHVPPNKKPPGRQGARGNENPRAVGAQRISWRLGALAVRLFVLRPERIAWMFVCVILSAGLFAPQASAQEHKDREFQECPDCPVMVGIPAGKFAMGSPASEGGRFDNEGPRHYVSVRAFALGKYDVTSEQFLIFLRETGYQPQPCNSILHLTWRSPGKGLA